MKVHVNDIKSNLVDVGFQMIATVCVRMKAHVNHIVKDLLDAGTGFESGQSKGCVGCAGTSGQGVRVTGKRRQPEPPSDPP